jgi:hypothetical protein
MLVEFARDYCFIETKTFKVQMYLVEKNQKPQMLKLLSTNQVVMGVGCIPSLFFFLFCFPSHQVVSFSFTLLLFFPTDKTLIRDLHDGGFKTCRKIRWNSEAIGFAESFPFLVAINEKSVKIQTILDSKLLQTAPLLPVELPQELTKNAIFTDNKRDIFIATSHHVFYLWKSPFVRRFQVFKIKSKKLIDIL